MSVYTEQTFEFSTDKIISFFLWRLRTFDRRKKKIISSKFILNWPMKYKLFKH